MKKRLILLVLACVLGGIGVQAQRPVGDTTYVGGDADYYYDTIYLNNNLIWEFHRPNHWYSIDYVYYIYMSPQPIPQGGYSGNPNRALYDAGPHIKGQEFATPEKIMVKGLAFCPEMLTDLEMLSVNIIP